MKNKKHALPKEKYPKSKKKYAELAYKTAEGNHIWLNAFSCVSPTKEFKIGLADTILEWLSEREKLLPASYVTAKNKHLKELAELTPVLYLSINKS